MRMMTLAAMAAAAVFSLPAVAQTGWAPNGTVQMIVNVAAGGGTDRVARVVQTLMEQNNLVNGQAITVVNRGGAGGGLGVMAVGSSAPDGLTFGFSNNSLLSTALMDSTVPSIDQLTPLGMLSQNFVGFAVRDDSPLRTPQDLIDALRANPQSVSFTIGNGVGNQNHIAVAKVALAIGIAPSALRAVVLESGGETVTSVLGGHIDVGLTSVGNFLPHVQPGGLRLLAVSAPQRLPGLDVPTWTEVGVDSVAGNWYAVFGPGGMSADQVAYWENAFQQLTQTQGWGQYLSDSVAGDIYMNAADAAAFLRAESDSNAAILRDLGVIQ